MKTLTLAAQTRDTHGTSYLLGSGDSRLRSQGVLSPFFQLKHRSVMKEKLSGRTWLLPTSRDIRISITMKAIVGYLGNIQTGSPQVNISIAYEDGSGNFSGGSWDVDISTAHSFEDIRQLVNAVVIANAPSTITADDIQVPFLSPAYAALRNAPQAAIANAPADAVTNYNTITTLLGALTGAVNAANTKQNDIATKLNSLLSELRTLGLIAT